MNTDKFGKSIREKLEGIDPPYREKDWLQFRSFLRHHGIPSIGGGVTWLLPTLSAAAVTGLLVTSVWLYRTNQHLEQKVQTLSRTITRLEKTPAVTPTDTVYITREVPVPVESPTAFPQPDRQSTAPSATERVPANPAAQERLAARPMQPTPSTDARTSGLVPSSAAPSDAAPSGEPADGSTLSAPNSPVAQREQALAYERTNAPASLPNSTVERSAGTVRSKRVRPDRVQSGSRSSGNRASTRRSFDRIETRAENRITKVETSVNAAEALPTETATAAAPSEALTLNLLTGRPMQFDSSYFVERYSRQVRRIRPNWRSMAVQPVLTAQPAVEEPSPLFRFRLGGSGNIGLQQWAVGGVGEVIIANHWTVGVGITHQDVLSPQYLTDQDFSEKNKRNFRHDYASRLDPRHEITNISRRNVNIQLPITVGYRLPLGNNMTVVPTAGISMSLRAREYVSFTYRRDPREYNQVNLYADRPTDWYNNGLMSINVEKKWDNWVVQGGPYLTTPLKVSPMGLNRTSAGLQARLLFEF